MWGQPAPAAWLHIPPGCPVRTDRQQKPHEINDFAYRNSTVARHNRFITACNQPADRSCPPLAVKCPFVADMKTAGFNYNKSLWITQQIVMSLPVSSARRPRRRSSADRAHNKRRNRKPHSARLPCWQYKHTPAHKTRLKRLYAPHKQTRQNRPIIAPSICTNPPAWNCASHTIAEYV